MHKKFLIFFSCLIFIVAFEFVYLSQKNDNTKAIRDFVNLSGLSSPSMYVNTPALRYRDLNNLSSLNSFSPALKESALGTFIVKAPLK